jgi:hypothetical protein
LRINKSEKEAMKMAGKRKLKSIVQALFVLAIVAGSVSLLATNTLLTRTASASTSVPQMGTPTWWKGACDNKGTQIGPLWHGLAVCSPGSNIDETFTDSQGNPLKTPDGQFAPHEGEFQCPELIARYMWLAYVFLPVVADGAGVVDAYTRDHSDKLHRIYNDNRMAIMQLMPSEGDVLSFKGGAYDSVNGHTAIVGSVSLGNTNGSETITLLEQNEGTPVSGTHILMKMSLAP